MRQQGHHSQQGQAKPQQQPIDQSIDRMADVKPDAGANGGEGGGAATITLRVKDQTGEETLFKV